MSPVDFKAPWSRSLRIKSTVSVVLLLGVAAIGWLGGSYFSAVVNAALLALPLAIVLAAALFAVRGYVLTEDEIHIKRLGGTARFPLSTLTAVEGNAEAMQGSVCLLAIPGVFSVTGYYWNRRLKLYRAFATDPSRAVVLRFGKGIVVITPHDPQHFIVRARTLAKAGAHALYRNS